MNQLLQLPPLSLYIHIPWCVRKCPYCDFNSHAAEGQLPENTYLQCLLDDLRRDQHWAQGRPLQSIFFGGGTPSLFSGQAIAKILDGVERIVPFAPDIEITLEANPGTAEQQKFHDFAAAGVNRLSIGIQSFSDTHLKQLGRIHSSAQAKQAIAVARSAGFNNFNLDLMHGLPGQTLKQSSDDLHQAIEMGPTHLSWYQLTIEPNTAFYSSPPALPTDDTLAEIQQAGEALLSSAGFKQYEVSAYSQKNRQSRHNLNYWQFGDYLAIGAGAHGKITLLEENTILRFRKTRLPKHYMESGGSYTAASNAIDSNDMALEFLMNALRLNDGFSTALFEQRTGQKLSDILPQLEALKQKSLVHQNGDQFSTTTLGQRYLNDVIETFL